MSSVKIHIKDDIYTIVDSDIAEKLKNKSIYIRSRIAKYPCINLKGKKVNLHRYVLNAKQDQVIDHINGNKLDNRRRNLRFVTRSQNSINSRIKARGSSKYLRVFRAGNKWRVRICLSGKKIQISNYSSRTIAALFADMARKKHSSVTPRLNFQSRIKRCHLSKVLHRTRGRIFSVVFVRRSDGRERHMVCRTNVNKNVKGSGLLFKPEVLNLFCVFDIKKNEHRFIPLENVLCLSFRKKKYRVVN